MLTVCSSGYAAAKRDIGVMISCLTALLQLRPVMAPCVSEWRHLLCLMMRRSCIFARISNVG
jgi:hypothetical protein